MQEEALVKRQRRTLGYKVQNYAKTKLNVGLLTVTYFALLTRNLTQGKFKLRILVSCFLCWSNVLIGCVVTSARQRQPIAEQYPS